MFLDPCVIEVEFSKAAGVIHDVVKEVEFQGVQVERVVRAEVEDS